MDQEQEGERQPTQTQKMLMKLKEHPAIPAGMLATCFALGMAFRRMHQRDSAGYQFWLRGRVLAQGATIAAIVVAGMSEFGEVRKKKREEKEGVTVASGSGVGGTSVSEQKAFEKRMREAEEAHEAEVALVKGARPTQQVGTAASSTSGTGVNVLSTTQPNSSPNSNSKSWLSWLGLSKS